MFGMRSLSPVQAEMLADHRRLQRVAAVLREMMVGYARVGLNGRGWAMTCAAEMREAFPGYEVSVVKPRERDGLWSIEAVSADGMAGFTWPVPRLPVLCQGVPATGQRLL
jgi:hypothetical protein